jgi:hypothetical protein
MGPHRPQKKASTNSPLEAEATAEEPDQGGDEEAEADGEGEEESAAEKKVLRRKTKAWAYVPLVYIYMN